MVIPSDVLAKFVLTALIVELTPGPNMVYLAVLSVAKGRRAGLAATVGIALGLLIVGLAAALGLSTVISNSHLAYEILRWSGVAYLFWLAWEGWREAETSLARIRDIGADAKFFTRGLITNLLNPKAALFYVAVLPAFVSEADSALGQTVILSTVYVLIATAIHSMVVALAGTLRPSLENSEISRKIRQLLSIALAIVALWLAGATKR
jgi:threonine/homoserine/homoserine lactone efflux protein